MTGTDLTSPEPGKSNALMTGLQWIYDQVSQSTSAAVAQGTDAEIETWIALACTSAGTAGFVTNIGGVLTLPVAVPANLLSTATIQLTLVARIAAARGYDVTSPEVRAVAVACLVGSKITEVLGEVGVAIGNKLAQAVVNQVSGAVLTKINQTVGFRLLTKAGQQGVVNLTKLVPVAGGIVGGTIDAASTLAVGKAAKLVFSRINAPVPAGTAPKPDDPASPALVDA